MLERRRRSWARWALPGALALVVALSAWAWRQQPVSRLIDHVELYGSQFNQVLKDRRAGQPGAATEARPCPAWRLHLRLDRDLRPPGPEWIMYEGESTASGYELHWQPDHFTFQLIRAPDRLLLGSAVLDRMPTEVVLVRRGLRLQVWVDDRIRLNCLDPASTTPLPTAWGFRASGFLGNGSSISLMDDRDLLTRQERHALFWRPSMAATTTGEDRDVMFLVRRALLLDPARERTAAEIALSGAFAAVLALPPYDPDQASFAAWLDWGSLHLDLPGSAGDLPERVREIAASLDHLERLAGQQPAPESLGLFLNLLPVFADKACNRVQLPRAPAVVLAERDEWLRLLRATGQAALRLDAGHQQVLPDHWRWQLRLCLHAATCLMGSGSPRPPPTPIVTMADDAEARARAYTETQRQRLAEANSAILPAGAPDWVVSRWRTLAGSGPGRPEPDKPVYAGEIPISATEQNPVLPALKRLLDHAALDADAAEGTARLIDTLERYTARRETLDAKGQMEARTACDAEAEAIFKAMPGRQAIIARALFVIRRLDMQDLVDIDTAQSLLDPKDIRALREQEQKERPARHFAASERPLAPIESDPLAYACYRLLLKRRSDPRLSPGQLTVGNNPISNPTGLPETLSTFAPLLSGTPEATSYAWKVDPAILPPPLALAAALAMQEVAGLRPEWRLLERTPSFTVPLRFLLPPRNSAPGLSPTGDGAQPDTVP